MKFTLSYIVFFFLSFHAVHGYNEILQVVLNNGEPLYCVDQWDDCCEEWEWDYIQNRVYTMSQNQRALRGDAEEQEATNQVVPSMDAVVPSDENNDHSERKLWPRYCANNCAGYAAGRCMALNCVGYRRNLMDSFKALMEQGPKRELFWATHCENQKSEMNNLLTNIKWDVGERCRSLLEAPRQMTCFSNVDC